MEDRYLFKAKRLNNGEWVVGNLITNVFFRLGQSIPYILCPDKADYDCFEDFSEENGIFEVDPSTICRYAGREDKNGKLIWENDIVKFDTYCYEKLASSTISQIKWCNDLCALSLVVNDRGTRGTLGHLMDLNKEIEVIGNIFDNAELLESEE